MKLFNTAYLKPRRTLCICDDGSEILYQELLDTAEIYRKEVGHEMVFILCRNTPGSLLGYLGCLAGGAAALLLDADMEPELFSSLYGCYRPGWICVPSTDAEKMMNTVSLGQIESEKHNNESGDTSPDPAEEKTASENRPLPQLKTVAVFRDSLLIRTGESGPELHPDLCLLLTTSGSTGSPKLVRISRKNLDANTESIVEYLEINENERPITTLPMNYSYGMSIINTHVFCGAKILLTQYSLMEHGFWKCLVDKRATSIAGVPYTYKMLDRMGLIRQNPPALRTLLQAGGKLPVELHHMFGSWCLETGRRFFVMYGQTEASPRMGYLPAARTMEKCGSMGIAIPGGRLVLIDEEGKEIDRPDVVGELVYYGDNVSMGYAQCREDLTKGDEFGGVLKTGDMARMDEDRYFYIVGRRKRFIKMAGKRLSLDETERLLGTFFPEEIACTGRDNHLEIYVCGADDVRLDEITRKLSDTIHVAQSMVTAYSIPEIPRNDAGKVRYAALGEKSKEKIYAQRKGDVRDPERECPEHRKKR